MQEANAIPWSPAADPSIIIPPEVNETTTTTKVHQLDETVCLSPAAFATAVTIRKPTTTTTKTHRLDETF